MFVFQVTVAFSLKWTIENFVSPLPQLVFVLKWNGPQHFNSSGLEQRQKEICINFIYAVGQLFQL